MCGNVTRALPAALRNDDLTAGPACGRNRPIVPFNDLTQQWRQIAADVRSDFEAVFETSAFCLGPQVEAFERDASAYLDVPNAIGVSSGTAALHLAMVAADIGPGDEVLVPAHTFIATIWCVLYVGATPSCATSIH